MQMKVLFYGFCKMYESIANVENVIKESTGIFFSTWWALQSGPFLVAVFFPKGSNMKRSSRRYRRTEDGSSFSTEIMVYLFQNLFEISLWLLIWSLFSIPNLSAIFDANMMIGWTKKLNKQLGDIINFRWQ